MVITKEVGRRYIHIYLFIYAVFRAFPLIVSLNSSCAKACPRRAITGLQTYGRKGTEDSIEYLTRESAFPALSRFRL